jgi:hypothetical protein
MEDNLFITRKDLKNLWRMILVSLLASSFLSHSSDLSCSLADGCTVSKNTSKRFPEIAFNFTSPLYLAFTSSSSGAANRRIASCFTFGSSHPAYSPPQFGAWPFAPSLSPYFK